VLANIGSEAVSVHKYNKKEKNTGKCLLLMIRLSGLERVMQLQRRQFHWWMWGQNSIMKLISPMKFIRSLLGVNIKMMLIVNNSLQNKYFFST